MSPGTECTLRAMGQTIRVRIREYLGYGYYRFAWPLDIPPRPSGWERWRKPVARARRLTPVQS